MQLRKNNSTFIKPMRLAFEAIEAEKQNKTPNILIEDLSPNKIGVYPARDERDGYLYDYNELPKFKRSEITRRAREILIQKPKRSFWAKLFCNEPKQMEDREITPSVFTLLEYLKKNGSKTQGIFRREGDRPVFNKIVKDMIEHDNKQLRISQGQGPVKDKSGCVTKAFDFSKFEILDLASALKKYIRDDLDGLYDVKLIKKPIEHIMRRYMAEAKTYCKYLIYSLTDDQRKLLFSLRELLFMVDENKDVTQMSWKSICNILSLTLAPQEAFTSIEIIPVAIDLFKIVMISDINDLRKVPELLKEN